MSISEFVQEIAAVAHSAFPESVPALPVIGKVHGVVLARRAQAVVDKITNAAHAYAISGPPVTLSREDAEAAVGLGFAEAYLHNYDKKYPHGMNLSNSTSSSSSLKNNFWNRLLTSSEYNHNKHFAPPMPGHTLHNMTMTSPAYLASHSVPHVSKSSDLPSELFSSHRSQMRRSSFRRPTGRSRFNSLRSARSAPKYANRPSPSLLQRLINRGPKASFSRH